jgi:hypothetical protein
MELGRQGCQATDLPLNDVPRFLCALWIGVRGAQPLQRIAYRADRRAQIVIETRELSHRDRPAVAVILLRWDGWDWRLPPGQRPPTRTCGTCCRAEDHGLEDQLKHERLRGYSGLWLE